jgi:hypothetical protein
MDDDLDLVRCPKCSATIEDSDSSFHKEWHERLGKLIENLLLFPNSTLIKAQIKEI